MYLKALEIQGFKSFPDRTVFPFGEEITAVVGPNGSGKSNISDAIRWVVGEQSSKTLRGGKMEDVIFGGTEKRKQTGYAQVSLVMDNSQKLFPMEETEVMITRKYFRSGESEYFINKHQVRLRDVNELFMGTGLGKEGYSVIGQGKIDEILSVKSEQRREVFEEAAGIAKYRHQKEGSEKKLERAQENLEKIQVQIDELERQVEPLREQSETAKKFLVFRDELRVLEISLWLTQLDDVKLKKIKAGSDWQIAVDEKAKIEKEVQELFDKVESLGEEMREKDSQAESLRVELNEKETLVTEEEAQVTVLRNKISNNEENEKRISDGLKQRSGREEELSRQIGEQDQKLEDLKQRRVDFGQERTRISEEVTTVEGQVSESSRALEVLRQREQRESTAVGEARATLSGLSSSKQEILEQDHALREELTQLEERKSGEEEQLQAQQSALKEAEEGKLSKKNEVEGYLVRLESRQQKKGQLGNQLQQLTRDMDGKVSKVRVLSDLEQAYGGFHESVKKVMGAAKQGQLRNIHGPVADLITVPSHVALAIETALGGAMQNIVVDGSQDGKMVLEFLKRAKGGRATVLPLQVMKPRFLSQKNALEREQGFVGVASELIKFDPKYAPVMGNLLGNIAIMENIDVAIATARQFNHGFRIVTLDGQVLNQGGSMTGGYSNRSAGILSRKVEIESLEGEIAQNRETLGNLEAEVQDIETSMSGDQYQLGIAQTELRQFEDGILKLVGECDSTTRSIQGFQELLRQKQGQLDGLTARSENLLSSTQTAQDLIEAQGEAVKVLQEQYQADREALEALQGERDLVKEQFSGLLSQIQALDGEEQSIYDTRGSLKQLLADLQGDQSDNESLLEGFQQENETFLAEIQGKEKEISEKRTEVTKLRETIKSLVEESRSLEGARVQTNKDARTKNDHLNSLERNVAGLEQSKNNTAQEELNLLGKLMDTYELSHEQAMGQKIELESVLSATKRIGVLNRDIKALGHVNIPAIEEFDKINERYTYLIENRDDIVGAKSELEKIIAEIVQEMEVIFVAEFAKINEAFGEIFQILFGGGGAEVYLENGEDVLGTGIEVKAQPPGKALKTLSLLSGGEKAMVAICLYFAILRIRPSPYVLLDEIDSALDERNIERIMTYLRQISDKTQFILITHRRPAMEAADVLFGITMQEKGISRMLRLNINEVESELGIELN